MKTLLACGLTAAICFGISATTGLGSSTHQSRRIALTPGSTVVLPEIAWKCQYLNAPVGTTFNCLPTAPEAKIPLVLVQQSKVVVFGDLPTVQRAGSGGFSTFRVR